jgi:phosphoglycerol transferase
MKFFKLFLLYWAACLIDLKFWISNSFGPRVKADNLISHVLSGPGELLGADSSLLNSFMNTVIFTSALGWALIFYLCYLITRDSFPNEKSYLKSKHLTKYLLKIKTIVVPITNLLFKRFTALVVLSFSITYFARGLDAISLLQSLNGKDFFSGAYVSPLLTELPPPAIKKNLIILYVESLEQNLRNPKIHGSNLIEPIDRLPGLVIPHFAPSPGTGWSIAGMVASQCSIPTIPYLKVGAYAKNFLPGAICLGDILARDGYQQYFLSGPDLKFAGMDKFYRDHGYQHILGRTEWRKMNLDKTLFTSWGGGIHDDTLLDHARKIITEMHYTHQSYNMTLITTDSHAPQGTPSQRCTSEEKTTGFRGAFQCSAKFIANFIKELRKENLLDDTVVVIMGDHPFFNNEDQSDIFPDPRYIYIKFLNTYNFQPTRDKMTHFDVAPTILDLLGYSNSTNTRFGLGVSLFSKMDEKKYNEHFDLVSDYKILNRSPTYKTFFQLKHQSF